MARLRGTRVIKIKRTEMVRLEKNMKEQVQGDSKILECRTNIEAQGTTTRHPCTLIDFISHL